MEAFITQKWSYRKRVNYSRKLLDLCSRIIYYLIIYPINQEIKYVNKT